MEVINPNWSKLFKKDKNLQKTQINLLNNLEEKDIENGPNIRILKSLKKPTQNIWLKNLGSPKTVLPVLLKELVIKQDIFNQKIIYSQL